MYKIIHILLCFKKKKKKTWPTDWQFSS